MNDASSTTTRDVVVIGGGPAGLSAALVLGRARRSVTVVDAGDPRNACSPSLHGFLTRDGASPADFLAAARREVRGYGVELVTDEVVTVVDDDGAGFRVTLAGGSTLRARRVIAATGIADELPDIDGVAERWGRDALHCPYCHGYEVRDRPLAVVARLAEGAVHQALLLRQWSDDVTLLLHDVRSADLGVEGRALLDARGVTVVDGRVRELVVTDDRVTCTRLSDGAEVPCAAVFLSPRFRLRAGPLAALAPDVVENDMGVHLATDDEGRTSVHGLWAVGNLADLSAQVLGAAELGSRAAIGINGELALEDAHAAAQVPVGPAGVPARGAVE
ncbi:NAD(P)/FAD-dependent oxidoreductase [Georgenia sp. H159]|uniref:NAD(P)/FAD-dependent oxidoreductase n=1 Tax=Georgenia sp. H159 TaxID=3076115 RepID=UPI002D77E4C6|nr:NAD(P)/FAD-dependent oxidoreductase [Georgenia sp. H159]